MVGEVGIRPLVFADHDEATQNRLQKDPVHTALAIDRG